MHILVYILLLAAVYAMNYFIDTYIAFLITIVFLVMSAISLAMVLILRAKVKVKFSNEKIITTRGDIYSMPVTVENGSCIPASFCRCRIYIGSNRRRIVTEIPSKGEIANYVKIKMTDCGIVKVRSDRFYVFDYFRIIKLRKKYVATGEVIVMPRLPVVNILDRITSIVGVETETEYSTVKPGDDPTEIFGIKEYVEGDKVKNIHWKLTAKMDKVLVKENGLLLNSNEVVIIDTFGVTPTNEFYDCLYGLMSGLIRRGNGSFDLYYLDNGNINYRNVKSDSDIVDAFYCIYTATNSNKGVSCASLYEEMHENDRGRLFYAVPKYNEEAENNLVMLCENHRVCRVSENIDDIIGEN